MRKSGDGGIEIAETRLNLRECGLRRLVYRIRLVVFDSTLRLLERLLLFSKPSISEGKSVRCSVRVCLNRCIRFRFNRFDRARETSTRIRIAACPLLTKAKLDQRELGNGVERLSCRNRA